jgi:hypothetical protein
LRRDHGNILSSLDPRIRSGDQDAWFASSTRICSTIPTVSREIRISFSWILKSKRASLTTEAAARAIVLAQWLQIMSGTRKAVIKNVLS